MIRPHVMFFIKCHSLSSGESLHGLRYFCTFVIRYGGSLFIFVIRYSYAVFCNLYSVFVIRYSYVLFVIHTCYSLFICVI